MFILYYIILYLYYMISTSIISYYITSYYVILYYYIISYRRLSVAGDPRFATPWSGNLTGNTIGFGYWILWLGRSASRMGGRNDKNGDKFVWGWTCTLLKNNCVAMYAFYLSFAGWMNTISSALHIWKLTKCFLCLAINQDCTDQTFVANYAPFALGGTPRLLH